MLLEQIQQANDIKNLQAPGLAGAGRGYPAVPNREDQRDWWAISASDLWSIVELTMAIASRV